MLSKGRERKKAKMEASHDSASGNEPSGSASGSEPSSEQLSEFLSCDAFDKLWKYVTASVYPICLLGAKGVGKSTILQQLHNKLQDQTKNSFYADFSDAFHDVNKLCMEIKTLADQAKEGNTIQWVFIDNIQEATKYEKARSLIKLYVKQPAHNKGLAIVAAVSGDGLRLLMDDEEIRLYNCDFEVMHVNPDKNVAESLLKACRCFDSYKEKIHEVMESFGWVPGEAVNLAEFLNIRFILHPPTENELDSALRTFETERQAFFTNCLKRDLEITRSCGKVHSQRVFALCLLGGITTIDKECVAKEELPWTFLQLKTEKRTSLSDVVTILAVSEQAKMAIRGVVNSMEDVHKAVLVIKHFIKSSKRFSLGQCLETN